MGTSFQRRRLGGVAAGTVALFGLIGAVGTAAVALQLSDGTSYLSAARSVAHVLGLAASLLLAYYASRARSRFSGGVFATSATYTLVGAVVFAVAFLSMELNHGFGINVLAFAGGMQTMMAIQMVLFTGTVFAFGWAYYRLARALGGV